MIERDMEAEVRMERSREENNGRTAAGNVKPNGNDADGLIIMSEIETREAQWLWDNRIPLGGVTLIGGDPGTGKSHVALMIASAVSTGGSLPGQDKIPTGLILMIATEDSLSYAVKPRLETMGADCTKIVTLDRTIWTPQRAIEAIEVNVRKVGPLLVIVDPVVSAAGKRDLNKASDVRSMLQPLMTVAEKYEIAVIAIAHLSKSDAKALYRVSGSVDFVASARSVFLAAKKGDEADTRILAHAKSSYSKETRSLSYFINDGDIFVWGEEVEDSADEILDANKDQTNGGKSRRGEAEDFLKAALADGPVLSTELSKRAGLLDINWKTLLRASSNLNIRKRPKMNKWWWELNG